MNDMLIALRDLVSSLQHSGKKDWYDGIWNVCPICDYFQHDGHREDCPIYRVLYELDKAINQATVPDQPHS
jgi:hypothetical protein